MFTPEKIEEWIEEAKQRPASAPIIIQFMANRLRDLSDWNEKLRAENIELRTGARVEDYERQIAHLHYQLDLLKRQFGGELPADEIQAVLQQPTEKLNLLVYGSGGRVFRTEIKMDSLSDGDSIANLVGIANLEEPVRMVVFPSSEELMLIFTSGRVASMPVGAIPAQLPGDPVQWDQVYIPHEPQAGDQLACVAPISKMALVDYFMQVSRRGFMKKIRMALAPSIMENQYIGTGVKIKADQTLDLVLGNDGDRYVLVSYEGYIQCVSDDLLPYGIVEAMRLGNTDHLEAAFITDGEKPILVMTQIGKVIHRTAGSLEFATDLQRKGTMLYSTARRERGVRVIGAASVDEEDYGLALHAEGRITLHPVSELLGSGSLPTETELVDFITFPAIA